MTSSGFITYFFSTTQGVILKINFKKVKSVVTLETLYWAAGIPGRRLIRDLIYPEKRFCLRRKLKIKSSDHVKIEANQMNVWLFLVLMECLAF